MAITNVDNTGMLYGRLPISEKIALTYYGENEDVNKHIYRGVISVKRAYKAKDDQYYPEDLISFTAFGATADYLNNYAKRGDYLSISYELRKSDDYEKDGEVRRGQLYAHVVGVKIRGSRNTDSESSSEESKPAASTTSSSNDDRMNRLAALRNKKLGGNKFS